MPVRAVIEPAIYREKRFSCACRAITILLKTPSAIGFFVDLLDFVEFVVKIAPVWHTLLADKSQCNYRPMFSPSATKIGVEEEPGMSDFFGPCSRPAVKLPSVILEATLSGDVLLSIFYILFNVTVSFLYYNISTEMYKINKGEILRRKYI